MRIAAALVLALLTAACASAPVADSAATLRMENFFPGRVMAEGVFTPRFGGDPRGLTVTIDSTWDGKVLILAEDFVYSDGERDKKTWRLTPTGDRTFSGVREDVIGTARLFPDGPAMRLDYTVILKTEAFGPLHVRFRDILALQPDGSLLNKAVVSKWGLTLGTVELRMTRPAA